MPAARGYARRSRRRLIVACAALSVSVGCDRQLERNESEPVNGPVFETDEVPVVAITDDGSPEKAFAGAQARRLSDGKVVVADQGSLTIRVFDREARPLRTVARRGMGPGELPGRFGIAVHEDTIFAFGRPPISPPQVHVYSASNGHLATFRPSADSAPILTAVDHLSTGEFLVHRGTAAKALTDVPQPGT